MRRRRWQPVARRRGRACETMKSMRAGAGYLKMLRMDYIRGILQQQMKKA